MTKHLMIGADPADPAMAARLGYAYADRARQIVLDVHVRPLPITDAQMAVMLSRTFKTR